MSKKKKKKKKKAKKEIGALQDIRLEYCFVYYFHIIFTSIFAGWAIIIGQTKMNLVNNYSLLIIDIQSFLIEHFS